MKKYLITGSNGFIGKNLLFALQNRKVLLFDKEYSYDYLYTVLKDVDFIFHLASGIKEGFDTSLTQFILTSLDKHGNYPPIIYTSSMQAESDTAHGRYKRLEEELLKWYKGDVYIYRLPGVFGRWARPEYNSVIATFIFNSIYGLDLRIDDPAKEIELAYIDDVIDEFVDIADGNIEPITKEPIYFTPRYKTTVGWLADTIKNIDTFEESDLIDKLRLTYYR